MCADLMVRVSRCRFIPTVLEVAAGTSYQTRNTHQSIPSIARTLGVISRGRWRILATDRSCQLRAFAVDGDRTLHYLDPEVVPGLKQAMKMGLVSPCDSSRNGVRFDRMRLGKLADLAAYLGHTRRAEKIRELRVWLQDTYFCDRDKENAGLYLRPHLDPVVEGRFGVSVECGIDYRKLSKSTLGRRGLQAHLIYGRHLWAAPEGARGEKILRRTADGVTELLDPEQGEAFIWFDRNAVSPAMPLIVARGRPSPERRVVLEASLATT
jgi:hypothetical protein